MQEGIYARFTTSKGQILVQLTHDKTPGTVGNFVALAEGNLENSAKPQGTPYYDGLKFHRVIADFMIQGGCPLGTGTGDPGYKFDDEFVPELKHDGPGVLSMANAGPGTNGSQFFITHTATPWLDGKHSIFGKVNSGQDVVDKIEQDDIIKKVKVIRIGEAAKSFNAPKNFENYISEKSEADILRAEAEKESLEKLSEGMQETESGLKYKISKEGTGPNAKKDEDNEDSDLKEDDENMIDLD